MSQRFPAITAKQLIRILQHIGFKFVRQSGGSHAIFRRDADNRRTVVPIHAGTILKRRTLKSILNDAGLSIEEFKNLL